jgi:hypothetical protein
MIQGAPDGFVAPKVELNEHGQKIYRPDGAVLRQFLRSQAYVDIIRGPIGSGTSSACCLKIWSRIAAQKPGPDGKRKSRWAIIRNTFPDLKSTTVKTWLNWFPEEQYGRFVWERPFRHEIKVFDIDAEVLFIALDDENDIKKMRSFELTGVWGNEGEFIERELFEEAVSRTGRYPTMADGGPTWYGGLLDMNAPNEDHWVPLMMGEVPLPDDISDDMRSAYEKPANWSYFVQPPGLLEELDGDGKVVGYRPNPLAENQTWLPPGYYENLIKGKRRTWVESRILNKISLHVEGEAVHPHFRPDVHVAKNPIKAVEGRPIVVGLDFGRRPAATFWQQINGRWIGLHECGMVDAGASLFAPKVKAELARVFPGWEVSLDSTEVLFWGDPKGADKVQSDERNAYEVFAGFGMRVRAAPVPTNSIQTRLDAVDHALLRMVDGYPAYLLSPTMRSTKVAMAGGYCWTKADDGRKIPLKNRYADFADSGQYALLGGGEGRAAKGRDRDLGSGKPVVTRPPRRSLRRVRA